MVRRASSPFVPSLRVTAWRSTAQSFESCELACTLAAPEVLWTVPAETSSCSPPPK